MDVHEQRECQAELVRHHRDFAQISNLVSQLDAADWEALRSIPKAHLVLRQIRLIVG